MATCTLGVSTADSTNLGVYTSGSFTPALNDLLVLFVTMTGASCDTTGTTDTQNLGWIFVGQAQTLNCYCFIAKTLTANSAMTVSVSSIGGNASGAILEVIRVSGMVMTGNNAWRQFAVQSNQASGTPTITFSSMTLAANPIIGAVANNSNPAGITPPSAAGWSELDDTGYAGPTTGTEIAATNGNYVSAVVTWGAASPSAFSAIAVELAVDTAFPTVPLISEANSLASADTGGTMLRTP